MLFGMVRNPKTTPTSADVEMFLDAIPDGETGKGRLYVKRLADVGLQVLRELVDRSTQVRRGGHRAAHREP